MLVKGGDYRPEQVVGRAEVEAAGGRLVLVPLVEGHSTTSLVRRAVERELTPHAGRVPFRPPHRRCRRSGYDAPTFRRTRG